MLNEEKFSSPAFANVAVTIPVGSQGALTYRIPETLLSRLVPGVPVIVPVGGRKITGIVIETLSSIGLEEQGKVKDILGILDESIVFSRDLLHLWQWVSGYYLTSPGEVLSTIFPGGLRSESLRLVKLKRRSRAQNSQSGVLNSDSEKEAEQITPQFLSLTAAEQAVLSFVEKSKRVTTKALTKHFPSLALGKILQSLEDRGLVEVKEHLPRRRKTLSPGDAEETYSWTEENPPFVLSTAQKHAGAKILTALHAPTFQVFLLYGVTGSGKTEVYLQTAQAAVGRGKSVLLLVPEIALTQQLVERVRQRFGRSVAVLHSGMVAGERWTEWRRIARGEAKIVVGVRSAVFAPLVQLGLIIVDEEHDQAYKQEEGVRYNARDLAVLRGQISSCPVILGSATPSLETYAHGQTQRYTLLKLPERIESRPLPAVEIVDLRQEAQAGNSDKIFSAVLRRALIENQQLGKQSVLFLNRRGYANYLQCRHCGETLSCTRCSVTLTFHLRGRVLRCHYCGFSQPAFDHCPRCHEPALEGAGVGTEQVEEALRGFLPTIRIARLDRDSVSRRGALERILKAWRAHEVEVLIGTQMVVKGHDVPGVTLVGVLRADLSLNFPDFRAAERTFQLLTQVAGRAGRGQEQGRVIIQTYNPQHYSVRFAAQHDFPRFATHELRYRKRLGYPPFSRLVNIRFEGEDGGKVRAYAEQLAERLRAGVEALESGKPVILGPAPAPIERVKGRDRWHLLLKGEDRRILHSVVKKAQEEMWTRSRPHGMRIVVDVDPYDML